MSVKEASSVLLSLLLTTPLQSGCPRRSHLHNKQTVANLSLGGRDRLDIKHGPQQVVDHLLLALGAGLLDLCDLDISLLVCLLLGLLVSLRVLIGRDPGVSTSDDINRIQVVGGCFIVPQPRTS